MLYLRVLVLLYALNLSVSPRTRKKPTVLEYLAPANQPCPSQRCIADCGSVSGTFLMTKRCSCDELCLKYGDCCLDFESECNSTFQKAKAKFEAQNGTIWPTCETLEYPAVVYSPEWNINKHITRVILKSDCPHSWQLQNVTEACRQKVANSTSFAAGIPVTDHVSHVHYKNLYCALCNGVVNYTFWTLKFNCSSPVQVENPHFPITQLKNDPRCTKFLTNPSWAPLRKCLPEDAVSACSTNDTSPDLELKCYQHQDYISQEGSYPYYKNFYCALCNGVLIKSEVDPQLYMKDECYDCSLCCNGPWCDNTNPFQRMEYFSFAITMDFNMENGLSVGLINDDNKRLVSTNLPPSDCNSSPQMFSCPHPKCPNEYVLKNNSCILRYTLYTARVVTSWEMQSARGFQRGFDLVRSIIRSRLKVLFETLFKIHGDFVTYPINMNDDRTFLMIAEFVLKMNKEQTEADFDILQIRLSNLTSIEKEDYVFLYKDFNYTIDLHHASPIKCPTVMINSSDYVLFENGSVHISSIESLLEPDDYIIEDYVMFVCSNAINATKVQEYDKQRNGSVKERGSFKFSEASGIASFVCLTISIVCLGIRIALQPFVKIYHTFHLRLQCGFVVTLFISKVLFLLRPFFLGNALGCEVVGAMFHWSVLSSFCWTNTVAVDLVKTFSTKSGSFNTATKKVSKRQTFLYLLHSTGMPAIFVAIALILDFVPDISSEFQPGYNMGVCWIYQRYPLLIFLVVPIAIIIIANVILFAICARSLSKAMAARSNLLCRQQKNTLSIYVKMLSLMGVNWIIGFVAGSVANPTVSEVLWFVFILTACLDGLYIFLATVFTKQVLQELRVSCKETPIKEVTCSTISTRL